MMLSNELHLWVNSNFRGEKGESEAYLKSILSVYLGFEPDSTQLVRSQYGKPSLRGAYSSLSFNLSHAGNFLLLLVGHQRELGVDIEEHHSELVTEEMIDIVLSDDEKKQMQLLSRQDQVELFFEKWTQKEALVKAVGTGISDFLSIESDKEKTNYYRSQKLEINPGYSAAMSASGDDYQLSIIRLN